MIIKWLLFNTKDFYGRKRTNIKLFAPICGVGCGILVEQGRKRAISALKRPGLSSNRELLVPKERTLNYVAQDTSRSFYFVPGNGWKVGTTLSKSFHGDTALDRAAAVFQSIIEKHGPDM